MFQGLLRLDRPSKVDQVESTYRYTRRQAREFNRDNLGHDGMEHLFHLLPVHPPIRTVLHESLQRKG